MKGRLPRQDVGAQDTPVAEPTRFTRDLVENRLQQPPYNERQTLEEHSLELESRIQRTLSENAHKVDHLKLSDSERATLLSTMQRIRPDVHGLREALSKCSTNTHFGVTSRNTQASPVLDESVSFVFATAVTGRPPDERERGLPAAPDWDDYFLQWLCDNWGQHVHAEPDYYYLRALSLYQFSQSDLIAVRGPQRQKQYTRMALIQAREANLSMTAALKKSDDSVGNYWRYHILASRIHQGLACRHFEPIGEVTLNTFSECTNASSSLYPP